MINFFDFIKRIVLFSFLFFSLSLYSNENSKDDINFYGFIQYDNVYWIGYDNDDFVSGLFLKDLSLCIDGTNSKYFNYFIKFDLSNYKPKNNLSEAYINYSYDIFKINIGQFIPNFSLEEVINIRDRTFMEHALLKSDLEKTFLGISFNFNVNKYKLFITLMTSEFLHANKSLKNNDYVFAFRSFTRLIDKTNLILHAGLNYSVFNRWEEENVLLENSAFKDIPAFSSPNALLRSHPSCLPRYYIIGFEGMNIYKALTIQSELRYTHAVWKDFDSETYKSYYFQFSYLLTGEKKAYDYTNGATKIQFSKYKFGSLELAFRYNYINITNTGPLLRGVSQSDGKKSSYNLGINWFINNNIRLQLNYACENFSYRIFKDRSISAIGLRTQFEF